MLHFYPDRACQLKSRTIFDQTSKGIQNILNETNPMSNRLLIVAGCFYANKYDRVCVFHTSNIYFIFISFIVDRLVDMIKTDLNQQGYTYEHILCLDTRMQQGSRSLLICLAWLIYHLRFIERCMEQCLNNSSSSFDRVGSIMMHTNTTIDI
jgi:hypothetical protein